MTDRQHASSIVKIKGFIAIKPILAALSGAPPIV